MFGEKKRDYDTSFHMDHVKFIESVSFRKPDLNDELFSQRPCDIIMQLLREESFPILHQKMEGAGLDQEEFVEVLLEHCAMSNSTLQTDEFRRDNLKLRLYDLFEEIDVNGNGDVDWEEFTHHILHTTQPTDSETKEITQRIEFEYRTTVPLTTTRLRQSRLIYCGGEWDKYCLLETVLGAVERGRLSVFKPWPHKQPDVPLALYAQEDTAFPMDGIVFCEDMNLLAVTTVTGRLRYLSVTDDLLLEETGQLQKLFVKKEQHLVGRYPVLRWDSEGKKLFAGSSDGTVTIIDPYETLHVLPTLVCDPIKTHDNPIMDLVVLPERASKKFLAAGLSGTLILYDIHRSENLGEIGSGIGVNSMSFCDELSLLVTCSSKDLDPMVWAPHAVSNPFVRRLQDKENSLKRNRLVHCECVPNSTYCLTADTAGLVKVWDIRKLNMVVFTYADGIALREMAPHLTCRNFAVDPKRFDLLTSCHSGEYGNCLNLFCKTSVSRRNPVTSHDSDCIAIDFVESLRWIITASADNVKVWDANTGVVLQYMTDFWGEKTERQITCMNVDHHGRRFYLGTLQGSVSCHSTATSGQLMDFTNHKKPINWIKLMPKRNIVISTSVDGLLVANTTELDNLADSPELFRVRLDECAPISAMDTSEFISLIVVGSIFSTFHELDVSPGGCKGVQVGQVGPYVDTIASGLAQPQPGGDADVTTYMNPALYEITCTVFLGDYSAAVTADTKGFLHLITTRPHADPHRRYARWKTFYPKATLNLFAVALCLQWNNSTQQLFVGDDQGNISIWDLTELCSKYNMLSIAFPNAASELMALTPPDVPAMSLLPRLTGFFAVHSKTVPIKTLKLLSYHRVLLAATENNVNIFNFNGDMLATLQQGRGIFKGEGLKLDKWGLKLRRQRLGASVSLHGNQSFAGRSFANFGIQQASSDSEEEDEDNNGASGSTVGTVFGGLKGIPSFRKAPKKHTVAPGTLLLNKRAGNMFVKLQKDEYESLLPHQDPDTGDLIDWVCEADSVMSLRRSLIPTTQVERGYPSTPPGTPSHSKDCHNKIFTPLPKEMVNQHGTPMLNRLPRTTPENPIPYKKMRQRGQEEISTSSPQKGPKKDKMTSQSPPVGVDSFDENDRPLTPSNKQSMVAEKSGSPMLPVMSPTQDFTSSQDLQEAVAARETIQEAIETLQALVGEDLQYASGYTVFNRKQLPKLNPPSIISLTSLTEVSYQQNWSVILREYPTVNTRLNEFVANFQSHYTIVGHRELQNPALNASTAITNGKVESSIKQEEEPFLSPKTNPVLKQHEPSISSLEEVESVSLRQEEESELAQSTTMDASRPSLPRAFSLLGKRKLSLDASASMPRRSSVSQEGVSFSVEASGIMSSVPFTPALLLTTNPNTRQSLRESAKKEEDERNLILKKIQEGIEKERHRKHAFDVNDRYKAIPEPRVVDVEESSRILAEAMKMVTRPKTSQSQQRQLPTLQEIRQKKVISGPLHFGQSETPLPMQMPSWVNNRAATPTEERQREQREKAENVRSTKLTGRSPQRARSSAEVMPSSTLTIPRTGTTTSGHRKGFGSKKDRLQFLLHFPRLQQIYADRLKDEKEYFQSFKKK